MISIWMRTQSYMPQDNASHTCYTACMERCVIMSRLIYSEIEFALHTRSLDWHTICTQTTNINLSLLLINHPWTTWTHALCILQLHVTILDHYVETNHHGHRVSLDWLAGQPLVLSSFMHNFTISIGHSIPECLCLVVSCYCYSVHVEKKFENPQTANLHHILVDCLSIHELMVEREREEVEEGEGEERRRRRTKGKLVSC